jgi:GntR family transcriptional repressor for pyruvate dehydrogenase complex
MPNLVLEQPRKVTVVESIVEQLIRQIQAGRLAPGDKLPSERKLIDMLGVGRSSIREALQGLAALGVVESRAGQGTFVARNIHQLMPDMENPSAPIGLQREMRLMLIEARRLVEIALTGLAAQRGTDAEIAQLGELFAAYAVAVAQEARPTWMRVHYEFHIQLAKMTHNPFYVPLVDNLMRSVPPSLRESEFVLLRDVTMKEVLAKEVELHRAVCEAVTARDAAGGEAAMEAHMAFEEELVLRAFEPREPRSGRSKS